MAADTFEDVLRTGLAARLEARGESQGEIKGEIKGLKKALDMLKSGKSPEEIERPYEENLGP